MVLPDYPAFEQRERIFNGLGRGPILEFQFFRVVPRFMPITRENVVIGNVPIGYKLAGIGVDLEIDYGPNCFNGTVWDDLEMNSPAAFRHADYQSFCELCRSYVCMPFDSAYVGFVNLDGNAVSADLHIWFFAHCFPDPMAYVPCGFVCHSDMSHQLHCANAFFRISHQSNRRKPFGKR